LPYEVHLSQKADKFLEKLDLHISKRIKDRLTNLAEEPMPTDSKFITREGGDKVFRYRIGKSNSAGWFRDHTLLNQTKNFLNPSCFSKLYVQERKNHRFQRPF